MHNDKKMWQIAQSIHSCALSKEIGKAAIHEAQADVIAKIIQNHEEVTRAHCHTCAKCFTVSVMYSYHYVLYRLGYRDAQKYLNYKANAYQDENGLNPNSSNGKK